MEVNSLPAKSLLENNNILSSSTPSSNEKNREFILFRRVQGAMRYVPDLVETCQNILDAVIDEIDAENCSIMIKDPISGELSILASRGKNDRKSIYYPNHSATGKRVKLEEGIAGWVLREGQAVMVNDVKDEPRFVKVDGLNNSMRSLICFPIREKDQVVGVFNLSHSKIGAFNEGDKLALAYISTQVGAALTSARFFMKIHDMQRLMKGPGGILSKDKTHLNSSVSSSTFIEVGEMMPREQGIFIYASEKMHRIKEIIDQVANADVTILIQGESGVGKEVVARSIHQNSNRRDKPFVKVNCAALPEELLESELFGYEKGAFTGAYRQKPGKFELANGGTIFLDEIAEISSSLQAKLLQVLQDREFSRLGGKKDVRVDVRILVATNKNIEEGVKSGRFREDLYYRLNVVNIFIPPLRDRKEEIPVFVEYFLNKFRGKYQKQVSPLPGSLMNAFLDHNWLGNIRELENVLQRFVVLGNEEEIISELGQAVKKDIRKDKNDENFLKMGQPSLREVHREAVRKAERELICKALERSNWNSKKAANMLNISYKSLLNKIKEYGMNRRSTSHAP
jgi:transcriptional regulator with GAF, ATPase, and Fis domain